ncbi:MAG TPA: hypothetical protein VK665_14540 [Candidatus Elarobacter sp.]|nr:hypothetical protein [Candidatus Elarobacter sp.]
MRSTDLIRIAAVALVAAGAPSAALAQNAPAAPPAVTAPQTLVPGNEDAATTKLSKQLMDGLRVGKLDRSILAESLSKTITEPMVAQAQGAFAPGAPPQWTYLGNYPQTGDTPRYVYRVRFSDFSVIVQSHLDKESKIDLFAVAPDKSQ